MTVCHTCELVQSIMSDDTYVVDAIDKIYRSTNNTKRFQCCGALMWATLTERACACICKPMRLKYSRNLTFVFFFIHQTIIIYLPTIQCWFVIWNCISLIIYTAHQWGKPILQFSSIVIWIYYWLLYYCFGMKYNK